MMENSGGMLPYHLAIVNIIRQQSYRDLLC